jgi:hypothetical protein
VLEVLAWSESNTPITFHITNATASSSAYDLQDHSIIYPSVKVVRSERIMGMRLDDVLSDQDFFDFLVLDTQGSELHVLKGLDFFLPNIKWIYTEVSRRPLYANGVLFDEIDSFLRKKGFGLRFVKWHRGKGWGDALYVHKDAWTSTISLRFRRVCFVFATRIYSMIPKFFFPLLVWLKRLTLKAK